MLLIKPTLFITTIFFGCLLNISCSKINSEDLKSNGFYAGILLSASGNNQTTVRVALSTSSAVLADDIRLSSGDTLTATANGITKQLEYDIAYKTLFDFDEAGTNFVISLNRKDDTGMPNSNATLPEKFDIITPTTNDIFNSGESITVTWSPNISSQQIEVSYSGSCISNLDGNTISFGRSYTVADSGQHTVLVDTILNTFGEHANFDKTLSCNSLVTVERTNKGNLDPNYGKGGFIHARQLRNQTIIINP